MECTQLVDLIFFMGQSNMAGRGDTLCVWGRIVRRTVGAG